MPGREYQVAFSIGAKLQGQFSAVFGNAQKSVAQLQKNIESLNKKQGDINAYQKQQQAAEKTRAKLATLQQQYNALKAKMDEAGGSSDKLKDAMLQKQKQIDSATKSLEGQEARLATMGSALRQAGVNTKDLAAESGVLSHELDKLKQEQEQVTAASQNSAQSMASSMEQMLSAVGVMAALKEGYEMLQQCAQAAIDFEVGMAGVQRTVGGSQQFLDGMAETFKEMSTEIPITTQELTQIATTAGQLGIARDSVESFTTVMAKLGTTTDLSADEAATMLAQFSNITQVKDFERLGSTIAELGDATATTASKVVEMSQGMAASAHLAGMSATDIMAISASVGSLGIEAQAGSTAMSTLISTLYKATETGEKLNEFASVANMTADEFKQAWGENAVGAMNAFIQGLNDTERNGRSAVVILDELGITNVRQTKAILGLASAGDLLSRTVNQASSAWQNNTALGEKTSVMYGTTQAKITMMQSAVNNLMIAVGDALTPAIAAGAEAMTALVKPVTEFISKNPRLVKGLTAAAGVIAAVTVAVTAYAAAAKIAAAASAMLTAAIPGMGAVLAVTAGIALVTGLVAALAVEFGNTQDAMEEFGEEFSGLNAEYTKQERIRSLCAEYQQLQSDIRGIGVAAQELGDMDDVTIEVTAQVAEGFTHLTADDFVDGKEVAIHGAADMEHLLDVVKLLEDENTWISLNASDGKKISSNDLISDLVNGEAVVKLSGEALETVKAAGFLQDGEDTISLKALAEGHVAALDFIQNEDGTTDNTVSLTASPDGKVSAPDFMSDDGTVALDASADGKVSAYDFISGLLDSGEAQVLLTPGVANTLNQYDLLDGSTVSLSAEAQAIEAQNFVVEGSTAEITGKAIKSLYANGFLDGSDVIYIKGEADKQQPITVDDYIAASDRVIELTANITNVAEMEQAINNLKGEADTLKGKAGTALADLNAARTVLSDMETRQTQLEARLKHAGTESEKSSLRTEIELQSTAISDQKDKVGELEAAYMSISTQYAVTQSAADELAQKEQHLAEVKAGLEDATGGVITATAQENAELEKQIAYQKELAEARMAEIRLQARNAAAKNAQSYADAVRDAAASQYSLNKMAEKTARLQEIAAEGADGVKTRLNAAAKGLLDLSNQGIFDGDQVKAYKTEISELWSMLTGQGYDYRGLTPLYADIRNLTDDNFNYAGQRYDEMMISMGADIEQYEAALASANAVQQQFVATLVSGVKDGGMSIEDMETLVRSAFADVVGGAELAEQVILQVKAAMEGTADAAEDMGESTATSSAQVEAAMQPILDRMTQLGDAYSEVYEAAYNSMSGQFKLFEEAPEIVEGSIDDMIKALYSQQEYMWEYSHNLQEAQKMGLSEGLLAQLSDGSKESAAYLATIVNQGATKIDELNTAFEGVEKGKETFAGTVAEMQTNFDAEMQKLTDTLKATVEDMDLSTEAANAGAATVQAFADAASGKSGAVAAAFRLVSKEAKLALGVDLNANGYASGTGSAAPGWAMVGENGPEMVWMNGGERVLNAADTNTYMRTAEPALSSSGAHIEIKPVYNIDGSVDSAHLRDVLEEQTNIIRDMVEDAMSEIAFDRGRSVYSR